MTMIIVLCLMTNVIATLGSSLSDQVHQTPAQMFHNPGEAAIINCSHSIDGYDRILWYKHSNNEQMQFFGYSDAIYGYPEPGVNVKINGSASRSKVCMLTVENLSVSSSAVYYCAARQVTNYEPAYFGRGTKLTVLEKDNPITPPTVKVFRPSDKECKDPISEKEKKKTIVCVASNFYPDHVSVSWEGNGKKIITKGVATDAVAKRDGKFYRISSRLTVPIGEWLKQVPYTCKVNFFNGTVISVHNDSTTSNTKDTDMTRENYLKITQNAKLSYGVLIVKSCVYAAFVCFLVWKLQEKRRKDAK